MWWGGVGSVGLVTAGGRWRLERCQRLGWGRCRMERGACAGPAAAGAGGIGALGCGAHSCWAAKQRPALLLLQFATHLNEPGVELLRGDGASGAVLEKAVVQGSVPELLVRSEERIARGHPGVCRCEKSSWKQSRDPSSEHRIVIATSGGGSRGLCAAEDEGIQTNSVTSARRPPALPQHNETLHEHFTILGAFSAHHGGAEVLALSQLSQRAWLSLRCSPVSDCLGPQ